MNFITIPAATMEEARAKAAERFGVEPKDVECLLPAEAEERIRQEGLRERSRAMQGGDGGAADDFAPRGGAIAPDGPDGEEGDFEPDDALDAEDEEFAEEPAEEMAAEEAEEQGQAAQDAAGEAEPAEPPTEPPAEPSAEAGAGGGAVFRARVRPGFWVDQARRWVVGLMKHFGMPVEVRAQLVGTQVFVRLTGADSSVLIGRQGYTLDALQHVVTRALTTMWDDFPEVVLDVEGYREKKLMRLVRTARQVAARVMHSKQAADLEPMTASERKYIHNALKDMRAIRTVSHGREPNRHIVIELAEGTEVPSGLPPMRRHGRRRPRHGGGGGGFQRDSRDGRNGRDGRDSHAPHRPPQSGGGQSGASRPANGHPRVAQEGAASSGGASEEAAPAPSSGAAPREGAPESEERLDWRPTFFKPPEQAAGSAPASDQPFPELEEDLYT